MVAVVVITMAERSNFREHRHSSWISNWSIAFFPPRCEFTPLSGETPLTSTGPPLNVTLEYSGANLIASWLPPVFYRRNGIVVGFTLALFTKSPVQFLLSSLTQIEQQRFERCSRCTLNGCYRPCSQRRQTIQCDAEYSFIRGHDLCVPLMNVGSS
jgi:hypothetical protein